MEKSFIEWLRPKEEEYGTLPFRVHEIQNMYNVFMNSATENAKKTLHIDRCIIPDKGQLMVGIRWDLGHMDVSEKKILKQREWYATQMMRAINDGVGNDMFQWNSFTGLYAMPLATLSTTHREIMVFCSRELPACSYHKFNMWIEEHGLVDLTEEYIEKQ